MTSQALHLNLDDAWRDEPLGLPLIDARSWGPRLRFSAPPRLVAEFYREHERNLAAPFLLYGSGDFHHLSALRLRPLTEPIVMVSFDNHPDWDIRPPKWCCGSWVNRALELPHVQLVSVWGCGNFECWWPHQIFGNRHAERAGKLEVHPWADDRPMKDRQRPGAILHDDWRRKFENFAASLGGTHVYITIDFDCVRTEETVTNWESGRFYIVDLVRALKKLRERSRVIAGDICGGYSEPNGNEARSASTAWFSKTSRLIVSRLIPLEGVTKAANARILQSNGSFRRLGSFVTVESKQVCVHLPQAGGYSEAPLNTA